MTRQRMMQRFARWHIWLGWLVGVPILMWTVTGLVMVARPIEEVRGDALRTPPAAMDPAAVAFPNRIGEPIREARLVSQPDGPVWIITAADGRRWRYSGRSGTATPPVVEDEARRIARAAHAGGAPLGAVRYFAPGEAPVAARSSGAVWQARFGDGVDLYIDDVTGDVLALRSRGWRLYDLMWGLHIMDLQTREDAHHPVLILFAALSVIGASLGCILLFRRRRARRR